MLRALTLAMTATVFASCAGASTGPSPSPTASYAQTETAYLQQLASRQQFNGSVLVSLRGQILLRSAFGNANWTTKVANRPDTRFRIGSITKTLTATAVMLLVQDGRVSLDDAACKYVAGCPVAWRQVTVRNLLTHTSGIPDYIRPITLEQFNAPTPPEQILALVATAPLAFAPGTAYGYSNTGYVLLGLIIERVSGMDYGAYLQQRIFGPLRMTGSGFARDFTAVSGAAVGYGFKTTSTAEVIPTDQAAYSDGGLYSTIDDLYKFDRALANNSLLSAALQTEMFTPWGGATTGYPADTGIGLGWFLTRDHRGGLVGFHGGQIPGFDGYFERRLGSQLTVIVLSNFYWADTSEIGSVLGNYAALIAHE